MNEDDTRCLVRGNMNGGGCKTEEGSLPASQLSVTENFPTSSPEKSPENSEGVFLGLDLYSQAFKALSERSPFDSSEILANTSPTLPNVLANLLSKNSDSRKKHKRQHGDTKSKKSSEKSKKLNIWVELEGYFRELTLQDIERLFRLSRSFSLVDRFSSCLTIPVPGNVISSNDDTTNNLDKDHAENFDIQNVVNEDNGNVQKDCVLEAEVVEVKEEVVEKESDKQLVSIDDESRDVSSVVKQGSVPVSATQSCSSIEWVLGSRNRVLLTTTRPSKKRKLLGENAGLERLIVAQPCEGSFTLCHVCSIGDTGDQLNRLVVCKSCKVVVHQKCYGVQGEVDESWMCSLCRHKSDVEAGHGHALDSDRPCVLCPKSGGACKRFKRAGGESSVEFAHLFCCQWMPEVHIDDTRMMEPILSVEGIKDVRGKLVCNLCKIKNGSCVRCSDGSCRTSFHPICAREASNKLEIWGKFGCDDIELRAFCGKHSADISGIVEKKEVSDVVDSDSLAIPIQQGNKIKKLKIACKNGDKLTSIIEAPDDNINSPEEILSQVAMAKDIKPNTEPLGQKLSHDRTQYLDLGVVLKKILERGKVSLQQIASEISIPEDSLATKLAGDHLGPEISCKILKWLKDHAYMDTSEKDPRAKVRRLLPPKAELVRDDHSDGVAIIDVDMPDVVPVKSVPPRRRTVGNIVKEEKVIPSLWSDKPLENDDSSKEEMEQEQVNSELKHSSEDAVSDGMVKIMVKTVGLELPVEEPLPARTFSMDLDQELPSCSINTVERCDGDLKPGADSFVHPYIKSKLEEVQCLFVKKALPECYEMKSSATALSPVVDEGEQNFEVNLGGLRAANEMGILDVSPVNEVEGEIIFSQQRLLRNSVALKNRSDQLVSKVVRSLPYDMDVVRVKRWDDVLVNQYIYELKEARKQSRKERRHKEAQAVLAAATAAVAASTRVSSLRKDMVDESSQQENPVKVENSRIKGGLSPLAVPRLKEFNSSFDGPKATSDGYPDMFTYGSGSPKEHLKSCDICRRTESLLNPILVCLSCKVAVHLNCYRGVKESTGPWYCELCEESSSSKSSRSTLEKPYPIAECGLCGASNGAFRKSSNGQWIHAICAEWVFDSTFRRGQVSLVAGMETVIKGNDICSVCHRRFGVCIKCNYGNCQATFHPSCARSAGYYMHAKYVGGGKMQHKAYCCKHSLDQKVKTETLNHGAEDLKMVKQHRVELEKLRLLCERIVKREKLKRELIVCNYDILASRRDSLPLSMLVRRPFLPHEGSSDSATTSLKGHSRSCSEAMQKSDEVTVDSALSSKRCIRLPPSTDNDQKADVSSPSLRISTPKPTERAPFAGKQIPVRATMARKFSEGGEKTLKSRKNNETLGTEMLMTSDQASSRNSRLPKGYFYVPIDSLPNKKLVDLDSAEKDDDDG